MNRHHTQTRRWRPRKPRPCDAVETHGVCRPAVVRARACRSVSCGSPSPTGCAASAWTFAWSASSRWRRRPGRSSCSGRRSMDRYVPPFWGRRRGWMAVTQIALFVVSLMLAGVGNGRTQSGWSGRWRWRSRSRRQRRTSRSTRTRSRSCRRTSRAPRPGRATAIYRAAMFVVGGAGDRAWRRGRLAGGQCRCWRSSTCRCSSSHGSRRSPKCRPPPPRRCATRSGSRSSASSRGHARSKSSPSSCSTRLADQLDAGADAAVPDRHGLQRRSARHRARPRSAHHRDNRSARSSADWVTTLVGLGHSLWIFGFLQLVLEHRLLLPLASSATEPGACMQRPGSSC